MTSSGGDGIEGPDLQCFSSLATSWKQSGIPSFLIHLHGLYTLFIRQERFKEFDSVILCGVLFEKTNTLRVTLDAENWHIRCLADDGKGITNICTDIDG